MDKKASQPYVVKAPKVIKVRQGILGEDILPSDIDLSSFKKQNELNPSMWDGDTLKGKVRLRLLDIADNFFDTLLIDWVKVKDIIMTGSLSNYTWSKYSDIDLHILVDFRDVDENIELVSEYMTAKKNLWNNEHEDLKIYGFPIEVYVQDINETHNSSGVYSLERDKWINKPDVSDLKDLELEKYIVKEKVSKFMNMIDKLVDEVDEDNDLLGDNQKIMDKINYLLKKIKNIRKDGIETDGEMAVGNIIFKTLRRNGYMDKLYDLKNSSYDKIKTLK